MNLNPSRPSPTGCRHDRSPVPSWWRLCALGVVLFTLGHAVSTAEIRAVSRAGGDVSLTIRGQSGTAYRIEQSTNLAADSWTDTGTLVTATGADQTVTVPGAGSSGGQFFRLAARPAEIQGFKLIPEGRFLMGDQSTGSPKDGVPNERPVIDVDVDGFYMKTTEVTRDEWDATKTYALANGYTFSSNAGQGRAGTHPVHSVNWYDALKWCNARSEQEGLEPCYVVTTTSAVYRTGSPTRLTWLTTRNGYRLPSEAEWEKAARGGLVGFRFPWGEAISHTQANYRASTTFPYDNSPTQGFHPSFAGSPADVPYTSPVGTFPANGYGLFDMSGNVREYCWDSLTADYSEGYTINPVSASDSFQRVVRGGDWSVESYSNRCSIRGSLFPDTGKGNYLGFRFARNR